MDQFDIDEKFGNIHDLTKHKSFIRDSYWSGTHSSIAFDLEFEINVINNIVLIEKEITEIKKLLKEK